MKRQSAALDNTQIATLNELARMRLVHGKDETEKAFSWSKCRAEASPIGIAKWLREAHRKLCNGETLEP